MYPILLENLNAKALVICAFLATVLTLNLSAISLPVNSTVAGSVIQVPQDFETIQGAINNATPGDVIQVAQGVYYESLTINKSITLKGQGIEQTILSDELTKTAMKITATNVTIEGFTIQQFRTGIVINQSRNILISENQITGTLTVGATYILDSQNVTFANDTITNNESPGVSMFNSNMTSFLQNNISHNGGVGIIFENSTDFAAVDNQIESNVGDAICVFYGSNLYIEGNTLALNGYRGIWATRSNGKVFLTTL